MELSTLRICLVYHPGTNTIGNMAHTLVVVVINKVVLECMVHMIDG